MSRDICIKIDNIDSAIAKIDQERSYLEELSKEIQQLVFAQSAMSTGKCASVMRSLTASDLALSCKEQIVLMEKTSALLTDAKNKFSFVDHSLAEKISN